ncbi:hypothetical protein ACHAXT_007768 [Thalassiosira profunda]
MLRLTRGIARLSAHDDEEEVHLLELAPPLPAKNLRLEAIKSVGLTQLVHATQDLVARTRQPLFDDVELDARGRKRPSIAQTQKEIRLESALNEALEAYSAKQHTFSVAGQCIEILGVEVSADLRSAKAIWCLPRGIELRNLSQSKLEDLLQKMQQRLEERGGKVKAMVNARLRAHYPPRITWVPAEHVSKDFGRSVSIDVGKKRRR